MGLFHQKCIVLVARGWVEGGGGVTANEHEVSFWRDESVLELDSSDGCITFTPLNRTL